MGGQNLLERNFSFFVVIITGSGFLVDIRWPDFIAKIRENFIFLILQDRFLFVHIPFGSMFKFYFHTKVPMNHLTHPVVSSLTRPWPKFTIFIYYAINRFVSVTTYPTLIILLCIIEFGLNIIIIWCFQAVSPWGSLTTCLYNLPPLGSLQGYILNRHRAVVYRF